MKTPNDSAPHPLHEGSDDSGAGPGDSDISASQSSEDKDSNEAPIAAPAGHHRNAARRLKKKRGRRSTQSAGASLADPDAGAIQKLENILSGHLPRLAGFNVLLLLAARPALDALELPLRKVLVVVSEAEADDDDLIAILEMIQAMALMTFSQMTKDVPASVEFAEKGLSFLNAYFNQWELPTLLEKLRENARALIVALRSAGKEKDFNRL